MSRVVGRRADDRDHLADNERLRSPQGQNRKLWGQTVRKVCFAGPEVYIGCQHNNAVIDVNFALSTIAFLTQLRKVLVDFNIAGYHIGVSSTAEME